MQIGETHTQTKHTGVEKSYIISSENPGHKQSEPGLQFE